MRWLFLICLFPTMLWGQSGPAKRAWKNYIDKDYEKAVDLTIKALEKDSLDALAWYVSARLSFTPTYQPIDIDQADAHLRMANRLWSDALPKVKSDLQEEGLTETTISNLRTKVDSAAFSRAEAQMTEVAFIQFLADFPGAVQTDQAIANRDSLAFQSAVEVNTYQAYQSFMSTYPEAREVPEARARYEKLYFDIATEDQQLASYEQFLIDNPATPYRHEAEFNIFRIMTAANDFEGYQKFLNAYPSSELIERARNYLFYLYESEDSVAYFPSSLKNDSLISLLNSQGTWIPYYEEGLFGFMDSQGASRIVPRFDEIYSPYLCEGLTSDVILFPNGEIRNRNLELIYSHSNDRVKELPFGLLKLEVSSKVDIIHKSGYEISKGEFVDAEIIGRLLMVYDGESWGLASLTGQLLLAPRFEEIIYENGLYFLYSGEGWQILTPEEIHFLANNMIKGITSPQYDQFKFYGTDRLWLQQGPVESLVSLDLEPILPAEKQRISVLPSVYVAHRDDETKILSHDQMQRYTTGDKLLGSNERWLVLEKQQGQGLFSLENFRLATQSDSVRLLGNNYALTYNNGNVRLHTRQGDPLLLSQTSTSRLLQTDQREWVLIDDSGKKTVINRFGQTIYSGKVNDVVPLTDSLLVLERYGKKELLTLRGTKPLQVRFDGIGAPDEQLIPLLSGQRFGAYDMAYDRFVRPISTKKIRRYNEIYYIAEMEKFGLINQESRMVVPFEFEEVRHWNDTTCLVRSGSDWQFYHIGEGLLENEPIKSIQVVLDREDEHEIIIFRDGAFGVLNNKRGEVIPPTLDDIINIGTTDEPLYFTDKYVDEANLHVVVYFDRNGVILRKQAMEEEDFVRVYCD